MRLFEAEPGQNGKAVVADGSPDKDEDADGKSRSVNGEKRACRCRRCRRRPSPPSPIVFESSPCVCSTLVPLLFGPSWSVAASGVLHPQASSLTLAGVTSHPPCCLLSQFEPLEAFLAAVAPDHVG